MTSSTIEEQLKKNGKLIYTNRGDSMLPLIKQDRDMLIIERPKAWDELTEDSLTAKLKKYDVPLYRRDGGRVYVLHRVLAVRDKDYVICGDNRWSREYGISDRHIMGVLTAVVRNGKTIPVTDFRYRLYVHLWCDLFFVRASIVRVIAKVKRMRKKTAGGAADKLEQTGEKWIEKK